MTRLKIIISVALLGLLVGCSSKPKPQVPQFVPDDDMCGASQFQNFIGKPLSALDQQQFFVPVRAIPENSAVTMDFNLRRLNFYANKNDIITRVYCG